MTKKINIKSIEEIYNSIENENNNFSELSDNEKFISSDDYNNIVEEKEKYEFTNIINSLTNYVNVYDSKKYILNSSNENIEPSKLDNENNVKNKNRNNNH